MASNYLATERLTRSERHILSELLGKMAPDGELTVPSRRRHGPRQPQPRQSWVAEARATQPVSTTAPTPEQHTDRPWTFVGSGTSKSGRDTAVFSAPMKNGATFESTVPGDLVRAILAGKIAGLAPAGH